MPLELKKVNLGKQTVSIPVFEKKIKQATKTILITAGMDGDEYAGIEAAQQLIEYYSDIKIVFNIIIIPIVNIPGYEGLVSYNPLDNKFPKLVYPGSKNGTSTEQLLYWLRTTYIDQANLWIDLHSGALIESLNPFVWSYETSPHTVNLKTLECVSSFQNSLIIYEKAHRYSKAETLAQQNKTYLLFESGHLGERKELDIARHIEWTQKAIDTYIKGTHILKKTVRIYAHVDMIEATLDGMWYPAFKCKKMIKKGTILGEEVSYDQKKRNIVKAKHDGIMLWKRESLNCKKKEVLYALAYEEKIQKI